MANNASSPTPSATLVLPPRLPLAQPLLPPFSFPSEPIFPIPHPAPIYGHPFRLPLMVSASKPKANERETRFQGLQPPVPTTALLPSQTAFEHRFTTSSLRNGPQGCVKQEEGGQKLIPELHHSSTKVSDADPSQSSSHICHQGSTLFLLLR